MAIRRYLLDKFKNFIFFASPETSGLKEEMMILMPRPKITLVPSKNKDLIYGQTVRGLMDIVFNGNDIQLALVAIFLSMPN
ncbi:MAG: hypothetical protein ABIO60_01495 [Aquaticitalea sp.]